MPNSPDRVDDISVAVRTGATVATAIARGPHRMTVGLRALRIADWIDDGADFDAQLCERATLLRERKEVLSALAGSQSAQRELLDLLVEHLQLYFSDRYTFSKPDEPACVTVNATGQTVSLDHDHGDGPGHDLGTAALRSAAHLVPEDLCLLQAGNDGKYRLTAAALCFPTRWKLADKIGRPMLDIHAPVPGYAHEVGMATDRVMSSLQAARALWRQNWSLLDSPVLYQPERVEPMQPLDASDLGERLWMRCERQTLRRLPRSGAVLFTIRIRQCTLDSLCREPGAAERLLIQLETMPAALKAYKGLERIDAMLCAYLRAASRVNIRK